MERMAYNEIFIVLSLLSTGMTSNTDLTLVKEAMNWTSAQKYCQTNNQMLASNRTEIASSISTLRPQERVWTGLYLVRILTKWAFVKGCYNLDSTTNSKGVGADVFQCQKICENNDNFALPFNEPNCHCMKEPLSQTCSCKEPNCFQMFQYFYPETNFDETIRCAYAEHCGLSSVIIKYADCSTNYKYMCDDNTQLEYNLNYDQAASICHQSGSFVKWFAYTPECNISVPHWTSGRRGYAFLYRESDFDKDQENIIGCLALIRGSGSDNVFESISCSSNSFFFCKNSSNPSTSKPSITSPTVDHTTAAIIAGVLVPMIGIILVVIVVFIRRRTRTKDQKKPLDNSSYIYSNANPNQLQQRTFSVANQSYNDINDEFTKPSNETMLSPSYELANDAFKVKNETKLAPSYAIVHKNNTPENYEFAQPVANESNYVYNSDYDHLHKVLQHQKESDYALTCPEIKCERDSKTYDTFAFSDASIEQQTGSDYDHLPNNMGSDPTYDCADLHSLKQVENNYGSYNQQ